MPGSPPPLPRDEALPIADVLLRGDTAEAFLRDALDHRGPLTRLRIRYLAYEPGVAVTVQYQLIGPTGRLDAGVVADARGARAFWYPHDPALDLLADPAGLLAALGLPDGPVERLAWVPGARAALRAGGAVIKVYAESNEASAAARAMRRAADAVPTAQLLAADETRRVVAQRLVAGRPLGLDDAVPAGMAAGALLRRLQAGVTTDALPAIGPAEVLVQAAAPVALAAFARPALRDRLAAVTARLQEVRPVAIRLVAAHGDYNVGQLLDTGQGLAVVDLDTLCAAPAAFDVAAYATNVVSGRAGDEEHSRTVLPEVVRGHGGTLEHLDWYVAATLLRRVDRAVRRLKNDWPARTDALSTGGRQRCSTWVPRRRCLVSRMRAEARSTRS